MGLVLERAIGEWIDIGSEISIRVVEIRSGGKVKIDVNAPLTMRVDRREIRQRLSRQAAQTSTEGRGG